MPRLGAQIWIERDNTSERTARLVQLAREVGLDHVRMFLLWSWVEPTPGGWDFSMYDPLFAEAERLGVEVKPTLLPNSPPWHHNVPALQSTQLLHLDDTLDAPWRSYVRRCVERYGASPAVFGWVLWNEPVFWPAERRNSGVVRSEGQHAMWVDVLRERFDDDLSALNRRWLTGYSSFEDVPFAEHVGAPVLEEGPWANWGPRLADATLRARWTTHELALVRDEVRRAQPSATVLVNPAGLMENHASAGYDLPGLGHVVDVLGSSFHSPWHVPWARREIQLQLCLMGVNFLRGYSDRVEVTEFPLGDTCASTPAPTSFAANEIAANFLLSRMQGAESVTGWCLNTRGFDGEVGEWALLDDLDRPSRRSELIHDVAQAFAGLDESIGAWQPVTPTAVVALSHSSQAVDCLLADGSIPGRAHTDAVRGAFVLAAQLQRKGHQTQVVDLGWEGAAEVVVVPHVVAMTEQGMEWALDQARRGATVVLDGCSGRLSPDAGLHRPWPVGLDSWGLQGVGLRSDAQMREIYVDGVALSTPLFVSDVEVDETWQPVSGLLAGDGTPLVWERCVGGGRLLFCRAPLATTGDPVTTGASPLLERLVASGPHPSTARVDVALTPVVGEHGTAVGLAVCGPIADSEEVMVDLPAGEHLDVWSHQRYTSPGGPVRLSLRRGIGLLVRSEGASDV